MSDEKDDLRKRTKRFALRVIKVYETLPRSGSAQVLGHQLLRSGTSVCANFREAHRAQKLALLLDEASQLIAIPNMDCQKGPSAPVIILSFIAHPSSFL